MSLDKEGIIIIIISLLLLILIGVCIKFSNINCKNNNFGSMSRRINSYETI